MIKTAQQIDRCYKNRLEWCGVCLDKGGLGAHFLFLDNYMDIHTLCEKTLVGLGYELVHLEYITGKTMSLFIDRQPSGVTIEDCVAVSQHFTRLFAAENIDYTRLEVSSPGLDRTLKTQADFLRSIGKLIYIKIKTGTTSVGKKKSMTGRLLSVEKDQLFLDLGNSTINVALSAISKARLEPELIKH